MLASSIKCSAHQYFTQSGLAEPRPRTQQKGLMCQRMLAAILFWQKHHSNLVAGEHCSAAQHQHRREQGRGDLWQPYAGVPSGAR